MKTTELIIPLGVLLLAVLTPISTLDIDPVIHSALVALSPLNTSLTPGVWRGALSTKIGCLQIQGPGPQANASRTI